MSTTNSTSQVSTTEYTCVDGPAKGKVYTISNPRAAYISLILGEDHDRSTWKEVWYKFDHDKKELSLCTEEEAVGKLQ